METSFISSQNTITLLAIILGVIALALWAEQRYLWAKKISAAILGLFGVMLLSNGSIIPNSAPIYEILMEYTIPLGLTLLLLRADLRTVVQESGRLIGIFLLSSLGSILATFLAYIVLQNYIPNIETLASMAVASYTGGTINFFAMAEAYNSPKELTSIALVADNLLCAVFFFVIMSSFFIDILNRFLSTSATTKATTKPKETIENVTLESIATALAIALAIISITYTCIAGIELLYTEEMHSSQVLKALYAIFTNKYLVLTTCTVLVASIFPRHVGAIPGSTTLGIYFMYIFLACIGAYASLANVFKNGFYVLLFCGIVITGNLLFTILTAKLFKFTTKEALLASNANIGGATTGAVMAITKNWDEYLVPVILVGTLGNIIGNYLGILVAFILL